MKTASSRAHAEIHQHAMNQSSWWLHTSDANRTASESFLRLHVEPDTAPTPAERRNGRPSGYERRLERRKVRVEKREVPHRRVVP